MASVVKAVEDGFELSEASHTPVFLELRTYRFRAHSMYDPELYRSRDEVVRTLAPSGSSGAIIDVDDRLVGGSELLPAGGEVALNDIVDLIERHLLRQ